MKLQEVTELLNALFESWGPSLRRYACHVVHSPEEADDLVQEAFMALYRSLREGPNIDNPKGWMIRVVRNLAGKYARDEKRHSEALRSREVRELLPAGRGPLEEKFEATRMFYILSRREEEVLKLRLQSLKYREIAAVAGINTKSVATLLARALLKLRKAREADVWDSCSVKRESNARSRHYRARTPAKNGFSTSQVEIDCGTYSQPRGSEEIPE